MNLTQVLGSKTYFNFFIKINWNSRQNGNVFIQRKLENDQGLVVDQWCRS